MLKAKIQTVGIGLLEKSSNGMYINYLNVKIMLNRENGSLMQFRNCMLSSQAFCARNLAKNLKVGFGDNITVGFCLRAVNTYSIDEFNHEWKF